MTLDETLVLAGQKLDAIISQRLADLETRMRADIAATGPEDEEALDRPPDPDAPWRRITVEEILMRQRAQWEVWRAETLVMIRRGLVDFHAELPVRS